MPDAVVVVRAVDRDAVAGRMKVIPPWTARTAMN